MLCASLANAHEGLLSPVATHVWKAIPAAGVLVTNSFWQAIAEVVVVPFISNYLNPNDPIQMTIIRDITMTPAVFSNVHEARPFRTDYVHDSSHFVAHGIKIGMKAVGPHILNATGIELKPAVRAALYAADTSTRFWTNLGVARQMQNPDNAALPWRDMISIPEYYSLKNIGNAVYEGLPGSLVVVTVSDNVLDRFQVRQNLEWGSDIALSWIPGNTSRTIYEQADWGEASGAATKLFVRSFVSKYIFGLLCSTTALSVMNMVGKIPDSKAKTIGIPVAIAALLELNHELGSKFGDYMKGWVPLDF